MITPECGKCYRYKVGTSGLNKTLNYYISGKKVPFYISGYRITGGLLWSSRITTGQRHLDEPHSLIKIIDGIELKA